MNNARRTQERFANEGFRLTLPRQAILKVLKKSQGHLNAEQVFLLVHKSYPGVGFATVYRNLDLLTQMGLISRFYFGGRKSRYELVSETEKEHHHHIVCTRCGKIINYSDFMEKEVEFIRELERALSKKHNFKINTHQIHFYGLCESCQQNNNF